MKRFQKIIIPVLACVLIFTSVFAGCSGKESSENNNNVDTAEATTVSQKIDLDLSTMNTTMVYSQLSDMMQNPNNYVGKTIKMAGQFSLSQNNETKQLYYNVTVMDATACCQQGLEFIWEGHTYPDDYPEVNSNIEVIGVFETYDEDGTMYCHLISNDVKVIDQ
ncbi:MAG: hypothetical protein ACI4V4_06665 [Eubacterium sp.]